MGQHGAGSGLHQLGGIAGSHGHTLPQSNSIYFSSCVPFSYIFTRTVQIQKTCLKFTQKPRENGVEGPFSTDSLDEDRSKAKFNLNHLRQKKQLN